MYNQRCYGAINRDISYNPFGLEFTWLPGNRQMKENLAKNR